MGEKPRLRTLTNGPFIMALPRTKSRRGLRTGDFARAVVSMGKHKGIVDGISCKNCTVLQRADGCGYERKKEVPLIPALTDGVSEKR